MSVLAKKAEVPVYTVRRNTKIGLEKSLTLHGGTAINPIIREMPTLSVYIDLTYVPIQSREESLKNVGMTLNEIKAIVEQQLASVIRTGKLVVFC